MKFLSRIRSLTWLHKREEWSRTAVPQRGPGGALAGSRGCGRGGRRGRAAPTLAPPQLSSPRASRCGPAGLPRHSPGEDGAAPPPPPHLKHRPNKPRSLGGHLARPTRRHFAGVNPCPATHHPPPRRHGQPKRPPGSGPVPPTAPEAWLPPGTAPHLPATSGSPPPSSGQGAALAPSPGGGRTRPHRWHPGPPPPPSPAAPGGGSGGARTRVPSASHRAPPEPQGHGGTRQSPPAAGRGAAALSDSRAAQPQGGCAPISAPPWGRAGGEGGVSPHRWWGGGGHDAARGEGGGGGAPAAAPGTAAPGTPPPAAPSPGGGTCSKRGFPSWNGG